MSVFGGYRVDGPVSALAGYVLLSAVSYLFPFAAPLTAVVLWYRGVTWVGPVDARRALAEKALLGLAFAALVVTGLPVGVEFAAGTIR